MTAASTRRDPLNVVIAGAGVAALEAALALAQLAGKRVKTTLVTDSHEFVYRPMTVREPFAFSRARRYPLADIAAAAEAQLIVDRLVRVDAQQRCIHTEGGQRIAYDALLLAVGARPHARYPHALTIDDRRLDETMHGLIQDIEGGYVDHVAFVAPPRMAWPLPLYELALITAARAYDMSINLAVTLVTPEDAPLAIFGLQASQAVSSLLTRTGVDVITSAYAEVPDSRHVVVKPRRCQLEVGRVVALPELYGPRIGGLNPGEHGFIAVDPHGRVRGLEDVYAAGDLIAFAVKHGGLAALQADAAAEAIAALAGVAIQPRPFDPVIHGMLLTGAKPLYLSAHITGGHGANAQITETPSWSPANKIAASYLAPYLDKLDRAGGV